MVQLILLAILVAEIPDGLPRACVVLDVVLLEARYLGEALWRDVHALDFVAVGDDVAKVVETDDLEQLALSKALASLQMRGQVAVLVVDDPAAAFGDDVEAAEDLLGSVGRRLEASDQRGLIEPLFPLPLGPWRASNETVWLILTYIHAIACFYLRRKVGLAVSKALTTTLITLRRRPVLASTVSEPALRIRSAHFILLLPVDSPYAALGGAPRR